MIIETPDIYRKTINPSTPPSGYIKSYAHGNGFYWKDDGGTLHKNVAVDAGSFNSGRIIRFNSVGDAVDSIMYEDTGNGRIGVSTTSPAYKFSVNGGSAGNNFFSGDGTAVAPAYSFKNDGDAGMFRDSANSRVALSMNGEQVFSSGLGEMRWGSSTETLLLKVASETAHLKNNDDSAFRDMLLRGIVGDTVHANVNARTIHQQLAWDRVQVEGGTLNDYIPNTYHLCLEPTASLDLTGIGDINNDRDSSLLVIYNVSSNDVNILHLDNGSTVGNRFITRLSDEAPIILSEGGMAVFMYDNISSEKWILVSLNGDASFNP